MRPILLISALCLALPAAADDRALLIGNEAYALAGSIPGAADMQAIEAALTRAGFAVTTSADLRAPGIRARLSRLSNETLEDGRLVIMLTGHFAQDGGDTWFLGIETDQPDPGSVSGMGVPLNAVLTIAARVQGGAVVLLGTQDRRLPLGTGMEPGIGPLDIPQGVTVVRGNAADIADFAASGLIQTGASLPDLLAGTDLQAEGFLAPLVAFRPGVAPVRPRPPAEDPDEALWSVTRQLDSLEAYRTYVRRFPDGRHTDAARAQIDTILAEPLRDARIAEDRLSLSRDDRRTIQRALALLGFDPRGIDGVFGEGSRRAINAWQKRYGHEQTRYLTREQIVQLSAQADRRAAELEREAIARRAAQEKEDRAYWNETGQAGDEPGLRSYLRRYPDGIFADLATERLAVIDAAKRERAAAQERAAWDVAREANSVGAYREYLRSYGDGTFAEQARDRIDRLQTVSDPSPTITRGRQAETALGLDRNARLVIELRLANLRFQPGPPDGVFDDATRRAIRRFQASRDIAVSGYIDERTMVGLTVTGERHERPD